MSRDKIEEMTKDLCQAEFWDVDEDCCDLELDRRKTAEALYNAGYRKQSEGEWIDKYCSICGEEEPYTKRGNAFATTFYQFRTKYCPNCGSKMFVQTEIKNYPPYLDRPKMKGGE